MPQSGYLSDGTTNFTSRISVSDRASFGSEVHLYSTLSARGVATFFNTIDSASAISGAAITGTVITATSNMSAPAFRALAGSAVSPSVQIGSNLSRGFYAASATTIALVGGFDLRTNTNIISMHTLANDSGRTIGELSLVFAASGMSLMFSSGKTSYTIAASAVSAAQS